MKLVKFLTFIFLIIFGSELSAGDPLIIRYSPANPVAGQPVTFTIQNDLVCQIESIVPDAGNDLMNLLELPNSFVYDTPGVYHVALDIEFDEACESVRGSIGSKRALAQFQMGPVGGDLSLSVILNNINCVPLTIAAPAPIPTMSQWGMIILFLVSTIGGVVFYLSSTGKYRGLHSKKYSN